MFRSKADELVNFTVGPKGTNFVVHAQPLARLSQALDTLINGDTKTGVIDWKLDTDEETFLRFCEFAYVRDYTPPRFSTSDKGKPRFSVKPVVNLPRDFNTASPTCVSSNKQESTKLTFNNYYPAPSSKEFFHNQFKPQTPENELEDFEPVLLGHARLYLLADKYDVPELQNLVLHKLYHTVEMSKLYENQIAGVLKLVSFVYDNTQSPPSSQQEVSALATSQRKKHANPMSDKDKLRAGGLRRLVVRIAVLKLDDIGKSKEFLGLFRDGGDFVEDFWIVLQDSKC